ncbi:MAG TPA: hypothetical protein DHW22_03850, partial [Planctomycetaceae bacterium]|nr:hypothetical protein [Planctomycetaceae bacterium]
WRHLLASAVSLLICLAGVGLASRWYLASTTLDYNLDDRFLGLEIRSPHDDVLLYHARGQLPDRPPYSETTLERIIQKKVLRVG